MGVVADGRDLEWRRPSEPSWQVRDGRDQPPSQPGHAKTIYALGTRRLEPGRTILWAVMRTATTDERARRWFRRYWMLGVGSGAHALVNGLLDVVRVDAEGSTGS